MNTNKFLIALTVVVVVLVLAVGYILFADSGFSLGAGATGTGPNHYTAENFLQGLFMGTKGQAKFSNAGALTLGSNGTAVANYQCFTASWNPGSVASSGAVSGLYVTSTDIAASGAVMGDRCAASLSSATSSGYDVACGVTGSGTTTVYLYNDSGAALDPATGTARACITH